ncbi:DEAD/DEAH box helicase [Persicimonas caeni]|nr:DEAD/DEAH box helicase [Persicimonas caeni]
MVETTSEKSFDDFYLSDEMLKALRTVGYKRPTPVQAESIPLILAGIDLIVQSQTGSGKTAAFAIPTIEMLEPKPGRIDVLVLAPTRELAKQVCKEFERLGQYKDLSATAIYGGASYEKQYKALETAQIVSATPGRLLDLAKRGSIDLSNLRILCLDEADEMLSMGFREELNAIVDFLPEERQSLLFSATVNEDIKALAKGMLYYPEYISLSGDQVAAEAVEHVYFRCRGVGRERDLLKVIEYEKPESAIIFANTRDDTFTVTKFLQRHGYRAKVLNGDLPQKQREKTLGEMREGKVDFIVATDVAARGIDITDLTHVINYTLPQSAEVYVHRTGRTGRAGKSGRAVSLVSPAEMATHFDIMSLYDIDITHRELPTADEIVEAQERGRLGELTSQIMELSRIPYGGKLGMARQLLETTNGEDNDERVQMLARLLSLGEAVVRDPKKRDAVTGRAFLKSASPLAPTPEAGRPETTKQEPTKKEAPKQPEPKKKEEEAKAAEAKAAKEEKAPRKERTRKRERSVEKQPAEQAVAVEAEAAPAPEETERPKRRRRRSRGAQKRGETKTEEKPTTEGKSGAKRRRSRGSKSRSRSSKGRKSRSSKGRKSRSSKGRKSRSSKGRKSRGSKGRKSRSSNGRKSRSSESRQTKQSQSKSTESKPQTPSFPVSKMYMNVGRDHFDDEKELLDMICYMSGFAPEDFGDVSVQSSYSFVQVREDYFYDIIKAMNNQEWKGVSLTAEPARK